MGVEPTVADLQSGREPRKTRGKRGVPQGMGANAVAVEVKSAPTLADVLAIVEACADLPNAIKAGIVAMIRASAGKTNCE